jgi:hypothetical protein
LKSGAHGYAQAGNEADDVDGERLSLGDCGIAPLEMNTPSDASTPTARLIGLPKFHPLTDNAQHRALPSIGNSTFSDACGAMSEMDRLDFA